jgi:hypothetical protein
MSCAQVKGDPIVRQQKAKAKEWILNIGLLFYRTFSWYSQDYFQEQLKFKALGYQHTNWNFEPWLWI